MPLWIDNTSRSGRLLAQRSTTSAVGAMLLLTVSGCAVGPDYHAPDTRLAEFHSAEAVTSRTALGSAAALDSWWNGFNDPELTRIVEQALSQNLDLAAALARVEQARAAARGAGARLLPSLDVSAQASKQRQSLESPTGSIARNLPGYERNQSQYDVGLGASWEIDLFGGLRRSSQAAAAEAEAAGAAQAGTRISVAADAADAYLRIRGDQVRIAVAKSQIETNTQLLDLVQRRFAQGLATDREVAQVEALLAGARASLQPLQIDLEAQLNRLDVLMGVQPGTYAATLSDMGTIPSAPAIAGSAPTDMLRRRPDIIAAERRLAASSARIGAAISDYYPKFSLSGLLGFESSSPGNLFQASTFQPQALLGLRWRLFDFGKVDAQVDLAKGAEAEALAYYRQVVLRAAEDVENAFTSLVQLEIYVEELDREVRALERARDLSQKAYEGGVIPLTDVLDANRQKLAVQDALVQARVGVSRAAVSAFRAIGGGWSPDTSMLAEMRNVQNQ